MLQRQSRSRQGALYNPSTGVVGNPLAEQVRDLASNMTMSELRVQDLLAESKLTDERLDVLSQEIRNVGTDSANLESRAGTLFDCLETRFDRLEQLLLDYNQGGSQNDGGNFPQQ